MLQHSTQSLFQVTGALPLEHFLSFWNPKSAGVMGCTGEADRTSKAGQFLRLRHTYGEEKKTLQSFL